MPISGISLVSGFLASSPSRNISSGKSSGGSGAPGSAIVAPSPSTPGCSATSCKTA
jgi:hypothetical protein